MPHLLPALVGYHHWDRRRLAAARGDTRQVGGVAYPLEETPGAGVTSAVNVARPELKDYEK